MEEARKVSAREDVPRTEPRAHDADAASIQIAAARTALPEPQPLADEDARPRFDFERALADFATIAQIEGITEHGAAIVTALRAAGTRAVYRRLQISAPPIAGGAAQAAEPLAENEIGDRVRRVSACTAPPAAQPEGSSAEGCLYRWAASRRN